MAAARVTFNASSLCLRRGRCLSLSIAPAAAGIGEEDRQ